MHSWGDEGVDWEGISDAAEYIGLSLAKYGRIYVQDYKEKYGTVRVYCIFGWYDAHSVVFPRHAYIRNRFLSRIPLSFLNFLVVPFQTRVYRYFYRKAVEKWPHLREEILSAADYLEFLEDI